MKFNFNNISIVPSKSIDIIIDDVNPYNMDSKLPILNYPDVKIIGENNYNLFLESGINVIIPKYLTIENIHLNRLGRYYVVQEGIGVSTKEDLFITYDLINFKKIFLKNGVVTNSNNYVYLDANNPYSTLLTQTIIEAKGIYGDNIKIMVGEVSNTETFLNLVSAGADYVILGNHVKNFIGYPLASLIKECYMEKSFFTNSDVKIIANIESSNIEDMVKSLALGADLIMVKDPFINLIESNTDFIYKSNFGNRILNKSKNYKKVISKYKLEKYTLKNWVEEFKNKLTLAMYYRNCKNINNFIGNSEFVFTE